MCIYYIHMSRPTRIHTYIYIYIHVQAKHVDRYVHTHACLNIYIYMYIYAHLYKYAHIFMFVYIHMTYTSLSLSLCPSGSATLLLFIVSPFHRKQITNKVCPPSSAGPARFRRVSGRRGSSRRQRRFCHKASGATCIEHLIHALT